jgi:hypothetical protein
MLHHRCIASTAGLCSSSAHVCRGRHGRTHDVHSARGHDRAPACGRSLLMHPHSSAVQAAGSAHVPEHPTSSFPDRISVKATSIRDLRLSGPQGVGREGGDATRDLFDHYASVRPKHVPAQGGVRRPPRKRASPSRGQDDLQAQRGTPVGWTSSRPTRSVAAPAMRLYLQRRSPAWRKTTRSPRRALRACDSHGPAGLASTGAENRTAHSARHAKPARSC